MCGSPLLKHLLHLTLEEHTHTRAHTHGDITEERLERAGGRCLFSIANLVHKRRQLKGIIGAVDNELIKAALVSTWVALALANNGGWVRRGGE